METLTDIRIPLPEEELQERFDQLQLKLVPLWESIESLNQSEQTIVVIPSLSVDLPLQGSRQQAYEERFLFLLFLLRQPRAKMVYVTSQPIQDSIIEYYLGLLPGVIAGHARERLRLVSPHDGSPRPLSVKLLERPRLIRLIRRLIENPDRAHMVPFNTTRWERDLALRLGIPMYGADPRFEYLGSKSGCRRLFRKAGVFYPMGFEDLTTLEEVAQALLELVRARPGIRSAMLKHNLGVSGLGNAVVDLSGLDSPVLPEIEDRLADLQLEDRSVTVEEYLQVYFDHGGVIEERITGDEIRSPSVQMRITPLGKVELLSTHDQLLGGPSGQSFLGSKFPADSAYALNISQQARRVAEILAKEGVLGRFAVDFLIAKKDGGWEPYAIELNLRKGGTTHPFLTLQFLTDGVYDPDTALFIAPGGKAKYFVATDHLEAGAYRVFQPKDAFDLAVRHGLHFDQARQTGVVFHMMTALGEYGLIGLTAVGDSRREAEALYRRTQELFNREAEEALQHFPLA